MKTLLTTLILALTVITATPMSTTALCNPDLCGDGVPTNTTGGGSR